MFAGASFGAAAFAGLVFAREEPPEPQGPFAHETQGWIGWLPGLYPLDMPVSHPDRWGKSPVGGNS